MRTKAVIGLLLLLTLGLSGSYGQTRPIDSLKKELSRNLPDKEKSHLANLLALEYFKANDIPLSLQYAYISLEFANRANDPEAMSTAYMRIGNNYSFVEIYNTALEYYLKSRNTQKDTSLTERRATIYMFLGETYTVLNKFDSAAFYLDLAGKYFSRHKTTKWNTIWLVFKGGLAERQENYPEAMNYYKQCLSAFRETNDTLGMINTMFYIAGIWRKTGDYRKEAEMLKKIQTLTQLSRNKYSLCKSTIKLARCYLREGVTGNLLPLLRQGDSCASQLNKIKLKRDLYLTFSEYFDKKDKPVKAYEYFTKYLDAKDSIQDHYFHLVKNLLDIRYNTESKIRELDYLKRENEIQDLKLQKSKFYKHINEALFFFFLIILVTLFTVYLIKRRSHRQLLETNRKLEKINLELKKRKEKQQFENQVRNKLFMILAHDLINPFNSLLGFAGLLSEEIQEFSRKEIKRHSEFIYQSSKQLHFLLENLLQWARIQTGRFKFIPSYFEINKILRDVTDTYKFMADKKEITLTVDVPGNLIVYADDTMITVILQNLIHNAIKYTGQGGSVTVKGSSENEKVTISVCDNGCGISGEEMEKLFILEHHFTKKGTSGEQGTGLGLIICKELLDLHNSTLQVESREGKGSCFSFSLSSKKEKI